MKVTRLEYQKKDPNFVNVFVDGKFIAALDANDVLNQKLFNGKEINQEEFNKIISGSEFGKLFNSALNFLSFRPRSEWEIRQKLKTKTQNQKTMAEVIDKLRHIGQADDEAFIRWFMDQRKTFRPKGNRAVKYELLKKGLESKLIDKIFAQESQNSETKTSEVDLAMKAVSKKAHLLLPKAVDSKSLFEVKNKLQRFLLSRGFGYDTVKETVENLFKKEYNQP